MANMVLKMSGDRVSEENDKYAPVVQHVKSKYTLSLFIH